MKGVAQMGLGRIVVGSMGEIIWEQVKNIVHLIVGKVGGLITGANRIDTPHHSPRGSGGER